MIFCCLTSFNLNNDTTIFAKSICIKRFIDIVVYPK